MYRVPSDQPLDEEREADAQADVEDVAADCVGHCHFDFTLRVSKPGRIHGWRADA